MTPPVRACVALGANLGDPVAMVREGLAELDHLPGCRLALASGLYLTEPVGVRGQPDFINAVAAIDTTLEPEALLTALLALEARHGRRRDTPLAARTLDLDLLLYGERTIASPSLQVPHPRMHQRAFVLVPLAEIAPDALIPGLGPIAGLLPGVREQRIRRL